MAVGNDPFNVECREGRGRCAVAARPLKAGTTIVCEDPWALVLLEKERGQRCDWSLAQPASPLLRCKATGIAFRSQHEQRSAHGEYYKEEYRAAGQGMSRRLPPPGHLAARALWRGIKQQKAPWRELVSHWEELPEKRQLEYLAEAHIVTREVWNGLNSADLFKDDPSYLETSAVARLLATLAVNAMTVADEEQRGIGLGLFPCGALLNHGEDPNCAQSFSGRRLIIRTIKPVSAGDELTIPYSELAEASCARRSWLKDQYHFDPLINETIPSATAVRDAVLAEVLERTDSKSSWIRAAGAPWNAHHGILSTGTSEGSAGSAILGKVNDVWLRGKDAAKSGDASAATRHYLEAWKLASAARCRLGDGHAIRFAIAREAMDLAIESAEWSNALGWARIVVAISRLVYDPCWPVLGLALAKLAKLELYHGNFAAAVSTGEESLRLLTVAYEGTAHILEELHQIVAQSRAEAEAEFRRSGENRYDHRLFDVPPCETSKRIAEGPELPPDFMTTTLGLDMDQVSGTLLPSIGSRDSRQRTEERVELSELD